MSGKRRRKGRGNLEELFKQIKVANKMTSNNPPSINANLSYQGEIARPKPNFPPSLWGDHFLSYVEEEEVREMYVREASKLKEMVRQKLMSQECSWADKMVLIGNTERLGVGYHFEKEVEDQLQQFFHLKTNSTGYVENEEDLFMISLHFRLLRQHGYKISDGVFKIFKNPNNDGFKKVLESDIRGLLGLYEAAHVRINGDDILEEAVAFTTLHLKSFIEQKSTSCCPVVLRKQVEHALEQPLHRSVPRLEARHYMAIYQEDDSRDETLLKLAKYDFNLLQMLHKKEIYNLTRWWKNVDLVSKLKYPRDRLVECYYWGLAPFYEPQYSLARIILTKVVAITTVIDDTYDAYGTMQEIQVFTDAVQRWNITEIERLPNYMKILYKALLDLFEDFAEYVKEDGRSFTVNPIKEEMKELIRGYYDEAKWFMEGVTPRFGEYMSNGLITSTYCLFIPAFYVGMKTASEEVFSWLSKKPRISKACAMLGRIMDDIATHKGEKQRGQIRTPIECYMQHFGVSEEVAFSEFHEIAENMWKEINEECLKPTEMPWQILAPILNLARVTDLVYNHGEDGFTHPEKVLKYHTTQLLIHPIPI